MLDQIKNTDNQKQVLSNTDNQKQVLSMSKLWTRNTEN